MNMPLLFVSPAERITTNEIGLREMSDDKLSSHTVLRLSVVQIVATYFLKVVAVLKFVQL